MEVPSSSFRSTALYMVMSLLVSRLELAALGPFPPAWLLLLLLLLLFGLVFVLVLAFVLGVFGLGFGLALAEAFGVVAALGVVGGFVARLEVSVARRLLRDVGRRTIGERFSL